MGSDSDFDEGEAKSIVAPFEGHSPGSLGGRTADGDTRVCVNCGKPAETITPTGHPACRQCLPDGPRLSDTLDDVAAFIGRFVVFTSDHQRVAVTLWAAHTYLAHRLRTTPYLHLSSPEPESGKSRLLDVLELLVHNPWLTVTPSPAVLYRKINAESDNGGLTLLLDEVDPIFKRGTRDDSAEAIRAVLNAGYQKGRTVARCVPPRHDVEEFDVFGAKALAGIGDVPATIASRSIRIALKRRKSSEPVEPLFPDELTAEVQDLAGRLSEAGEVSLDGLRRIRRELLSHGLGDRAADGWSSLLAIAEDASGSWPARALGSAKVLSRKQTNESDNLGIRLLEDSRMVLRGWRHDHVFSNDLRDRLIDLEDAPWADHYGKSVSQRRIATLLAQYEVRSATRRIGDTTRKGYSIIGFEDAWERYLPEGAVTGVTTQSVEEESASPYRSQTADVTGSEDRNSPAAHRDVTDVTDGVAGAEPIQDAFDAEELWANPLLAFPDAEQIGCVVCDELGDPCTCPEALESLIDTQVCGHQGELQLLRGHAMHIGCAPTSWVREIETGDLTNSSESAPVSVQREGI